MNKQSKTDDRRSLTPQMILALATLLSAAGGFFGGFLGKNAALEKELAVLKTVQESQAALVQRNVTDISDNRRNIIALYQEGRVSLPPYVPEEEDRPPQPKGILDHQKIRFKQ